MKNRHGLLLFMRNKSTCWLITCMWKRQCPHMDQRFQAGSTEPLSSRRFSVFKQQSESSVTRCYRHQEGLGMSNMHRPLYLCKSWFLVRTCSLRVRSLCCCTSELRSMPGMARICSRVSWMRCLSLFNSWCTSWLSLSMLLEQNPHRWALLSVMTEKGPDHRLTSNAWHTGLFRLGKQWKSQRSWDNVN